VRETAGEKKAGEKPLVKDRWWKTAGKKTVCKKTVVSFRLSVFSADDWEMVFVTTD